MNDVRKCLVWDLDNTLWDGICLEGHVRVRREAVETIAELDRRGILQSIASRGEADLAMQTLEAYGLAEYFLVPQVNWLPKSQSIIRISKDLGLSFDAIAFIDDDRFEREQIAYMLPEVLTLDSAVVRELPTLADFSPGEITAEARGRRRLYQAEQDRVRAEADFGSREEFLLSCEMKLAVRRATEPDIPRVLELMTRTHQLNTTGVMLDRTDVEAIVRGTSGGTAVMVAELRDRFGGYGIVGLAVIESDRPVCRVAAFAVSCRVMGRGIERAFLGSMMRTASAGGYTHSEAVYRDTGRNRMMRALYQMMGFRKSGDADDMGTLLFRACIEEIPGVPRWVEVV